MANTVAFQRSEYQNALPAWQLVKTLCAGEQAVKEAGETLLPNPCIVGTTGESKAELERVYGRYKDRAMFLNVVGRTRTSLVGAVFRKAPVLEIPPSLAYMATDADGAGVSIYQQSQAVLEEVMSTGRAGLLVDYPQTQGPASVADMQAGLIRANIVRYSAEQIVNWQFARVGGKHVLSRVVLEETADDVDGFSSTPVLQYRELLMQDGAYTVRLWRKDSNANWVQFGEDVVPRTASGSTWSVIPFQFVGATNNDAGIDAAPLYDLAVVNRKHYQVGADWYNALFYAGQPQPVVSGLSEEWRDFLQKEGFVVGSRSILPLPVGGAFQFATVPADTAIQKELADLEARMVSLGARLVQKGEASKTATQAAGEQEVSHSVVSLAAENVSDAYTQALKWAQAFMGGAAECEYRLHGDIASQVIDAAMVQALVGARQSGDIPQADVIRYFQRVGLIDSEKSVEQVIEEASGAGINLDG